MQVHGDQLSPKYGKKRNARRDQYARQHQLQAKGLPYAVIVFLPAILGRKNAYAGKPAE